MDTKMNQYLKDKTEADAIRKSLTINRTNDSKDNSNTVNARGYVRPKQYKRRLPKLISSSTTSDSESKRRNCQGQDTNMNLECGATTVSAQKQIFLIEGSNFVEFSQEAIKSSETTTDETSSAKLDGNTGKNMLSNEAPRSNTENPINIEQTITEGELINFIRQQERVSIDNLLTDLESHSKLASNDNEETIISDEEEDFNEEVIPDKPIQPGHALTTKMAVMVVWMFAITHSLTSTQLMDLLTLINLLLLHKHPVFESLYKFKKFFSDVKLPAEKHFFCSHCLTAITVAQQVCPNEKCAKALDSLGSKNYFFALSVESQLQNFFQRQEFREGLKHRFHKFKKGKNNIEDVYDSFQYKKLSDNDGPLSKWNNISFVFNTDGVPVFKSSKTSMWPIFLMINELPFKMRKSREYMILAGLWCGSSKPTMNVFLNPLLDTMKKLQNGVSCLTENNENVSVKAFLFALSCDLPARSAVLNMNQHNGDCCCIKCLQHGLNHRTSAGGNVRVFPYNKDNPEGPTRLHETVLENAREALNSNKPFVNGIKGPSVAMFFPEFDSVKNVAIDYMHLVCLGTVRLLLKLWFDVSHSLQGYSMYKYRDIVDSRLIKIKVPHFITRQPRSIGEHLKFWKASELRSWMFYYSVPCIFDLLQPIYLYHYCALVEAIGLLCKDSISPADIQKSEKLLSYFVFMFAPLYADKCMTLNIHSLLHLPRTVQDLGPLWSLSCFSFESANGELTKLFHGTQHIDWQIINAVHVFQLLPTLSDTVTHRSVAYSFIKGLVKQSQFESNSFQLLGKSYIKILDRRTDMCICKFLNTPIQILQFYRRAYIRGVSYQSVEYTRVTKRNSYCVKYFSEGILHFGFILWYGHHRASAEELNPNADVKFACIKRLVRKEVNIFNMNIDKVLPDQSILSNFMNITMPQTHFMQPTMDLHIVPLYNIFEMCICVNIDGYVVVCEEPNHHEKNL